MRCAGLAGRCRHLVIVAAILSLAVSGCSSDSTGPGDDDVRRVDCDSTRTDACILVCPLGDETFRVTLKDSLGVALCDSAGTWLDFGNCPLSICGGAHPHWPQVFPDSCDSATGVHFFGIAASLDSCAACTVGVYAGGALCRSLPAVFFDTDSDHCVTEADYRFSDACNDYDCDGVIRPQDAAIHGQHLGHCCPASAGGRLYVLNQGDGTLYIYNAATMERADSVDLGTTNPHYIDFSPDGSQYYVVALEDFGRILAYDAATNALLRSVVSPPQTVPSAIAITADGRFGYVSNFQGLTPADRTRILKYDLSTMTLVGTPLAGAVTHDLKITPDGRIVVASNRTSNDVTMLYTDADTVVWVPIDPDSLYPLPTLKYGPFGILMDAGRDRAFVACVDAFQVRILSLSERRIIDSIDIPVRSSAIPGTVSGPTLMAYDPVTDHLFVTTQMGNSIVVVNVNEGSVAADIPVSAARSFGITISDDGSRIYAACVNPLGRQGRVYVIDNSVHPPAVVDSVDVGNQSYALIWRPK